MRAAFSLFVAVMKESGRARAERDVRWQKEAVVEIFAEEDACEDRGKEGRKEEREKKDEVWMESECRDGAMQRVRGE